MPTMKILDHTGHRSYQWDATNIDAAAAQFALLRSEGRMPFAVQADGVAPIQVHNFEPAMTADLIWLSATAGG